MVTKSRRQRTVVVYWVFTTLFSLGMLMSGLSDLFKVEQAVRIMTHLGFPLFLMRFMGVVKLLGVAVLLVPRFSVLKEWAYAGFVFNLVGGFYAHLCVSDPPADATRPLLFLLLLTGSYAFYAGRRLWARETGVATAG